MTDYIPERAAEPDATDQLPTVEPAPAEPAKAPFWTLKNRQYAYRGVFVLMVAMGIHFGLLTVESIGQWVDMLAAAGPGLACLIGAAANVMALKNPTPDAS